MLEGQQSQGKNATIVKKDVHPHIIELEKLQAATHFVDGAQYINEYCSYLKALKTSNNESNKKSFNEFLADHKDFQNKKDKVIIARFEGDALRLKGGEELDGADFSGCHFIDATFERELINVSFRDCYFKRVTFQFTDLKNVDMRGAKLQNCTFFGYTEREKVSGLKLSYNDPNEVQRKGVFKVLDATKLEKQLAVLNRESEKDLAQKIKKIQEENQGSGLSRFFNSFNILAADTQANTDIQIGNVKRDAEEFLKMQKILLENASFITLNETQNHPVHVPNLSKEEASKNHQAILATRADLQAYIVKCSALGADQDKPSFNEFMLKRKGIVETADTFYYADLKQADISGLNLNSLNLNMVNFAGCTAVGTTFANAKLIGSCFERANLSDANFSKANATDAHFVGAWSEKNRPAVFKETWLIRAQMQKSHFPGSNFDEALLYGADAMGAEWEGAHLNKAEASRSDFSKANLNYIDAQYVRMRFAELSGALMEKADLYGADFTGAVMKKIALKDTKLKNATLKRAELQFANLEKAILEEINAEGADLSEANLEQVKGRLANLQNAILDKVKADRAEFIDACMDKVKARGANFENAVMDGLRGERMDLTDAILKAARLHGAKMQDACLKNIKAQKADFTGSDLSRIDGELGDFSSAILDKVNLTAANLKAAKLNNVKARNAILDNADISNATVINSDLEGSSVANLKFNDATVIAFTNLANTHGEGAYKLKDHQKKLMKDLNKNGWFKKSRYGSQLTQEQRKNRRAAQELGAKIILAASAGGTGYVFAGPLAGLSAATLGGLFAPGSLDIMIAMQNKADTASLKNYVKSKKVKPQDIPDVQPDVQLDYLNNSIGDRLAEVGVFAQSLGIGAADGAIKGAYGGAIAGTVLASMGMANSILIFGAGKGTSYLGNKIYNNSKNIYSTVGGAVVWGLGKAVSYFPFVSAGLITSVGVAAGASLGAVGGSTYKAFTTIQRLWKFELDEYGEKANNNKGSTPEEIWLENNRKLQDLWDQILPTRKKHNLGIACAVIFTATTCLGAGIAMPLLGYSGFSVISTVLTIIPPSLVAGYGFGYLYAEKALPSFMVGKLSLVGSHAGNAIKGLYETCHHYMVQEELIASMKTGHVPDFSSQSSHS
jgi:uncharacterized protein YjbI with pentapeptide repeats